jgi:hypothetical protein
VKENRLDTSFPRPRTCSTKQTARTIMPRLNDNEFGRL